jgi:hypothetical protein
MWEPPALGLPFYRGFQIYAITKIKYFRDVIIIHDTWWLTFLDKFFWPMPLSTLRVYCTLNVGWPIFHLINVTESVVLAGIDSIGGVRIPGAYCGVLAFRPSHAVVSNSGVIPVAPSLDTIGICWNCFFSSVEFMS